MSGAKLSIWYWVFGAQCIERDMSKSREEVAAMREEYGSRELRRADLTSDPFVQFEQWFVEAREVEIYEPNAMVLSTVGPDGCPASRTVLLPRNENDTLLTPPDINAPGRFFFI